MDKYLPNPRHSSPRMLDMFGFLGKLVGVSMRQRLYLPFSLPSLIWKHFVGEPVTLEDVRQVCACVRVRASVQTPVCMFTCLLPQFLIAEDTVALCVSVFISRHSRPNYRASIISTQVLWLLCLFELSCWPLS